MPVLRPLAIALALSGPLPAAAGPVADTAARIEAALAAGDGRAAVAEAQALMDAVWQASGFGVAYAVLTEPGGAGYGLYEPRTSVVYAPGEPIVLYVETFGYGFGEPAKGLYRIALGVDLEVLSEAGDRLGLMPDIAALEHASRRRAKEFSGRITYNLTAPPGRYILVTTLRDQHSAGTASFRNIIEVRG